MKILLAILMMNSCINLACQPTIVVGGGPPPTLPLAPTLTYSGGNLAVTNNDPGTPTAYELWYKPDGTMIYSLSISSSSPLFESNPGWGQWLARVKVAGVFSPYSAMVLVSDPTAVPVPPQGGPRAYFWDNANQILGVPFHGGKVEPAEDDPSVQTWDAVRLYQSFDFGVTWVLVAETGPWGGWTIDTVHNLKTGNLAAFSPPDFDPFNYIKWTTVLHGVESDPAGAGALLIYKPPGWVMPAGVNQVDNGQPNVPASRITEDGNVRVTEDGYLRLPEY